MQIITNLPDKLSSSFDKITNFFSKGGGEPNRRSAYPSDKNILNYGFHAQNLEGGKVVPTLKGGDRNDLFASLQHFFAKSMNKQCGKFLFSLTKTMRPLTNSIFASITTAHAAPNFLQTFSHF